jgi:hypothetical protein
MSKRELHGSLFDPKDEGLVSLRSIRNSWWITVELLEALTWILGG